jgi:hypothetical protein
MIKFKTYYFFAFIRKTFIVSVLSLLSLQTYSQIIPETPVNNEDIEQKFENIAENIDAEIDYTELVETLNFYKENPINLNKTNAEELKKLLLLNDIQINNLINYLTNNGQMVSIYELQLVNGFDNKIIFKIIPYVTVEKVEKRASLKPKDIFKYGRNTLITRYQVIPEDQKGYSDITDSAIAANPNQRYLGSSAKLYTKYAFNYRDLVKFGFVADKDAGEEFFKGTQKNGFDFYSAYFALKNIGFVKSLVIGDYQAQFGQGLTLWTGLGFGKSGNAIDVKKYAQGIKPYSSANESGFLRGIATTILLKNLEFSLFYSYKNSDANIGEQDSLSQENLYITSLQETGYHRTPNELADKNSLKETMYGSNVSFRKNNLKVGITAYRFLLNTELLKNSKPYNQFEFQGKKNSNYGFNYQYLFYPFNFFGEISTSENGGIAYINGLQANLDNRFAFSMIHRNYQKDYQNLKSVAFGENSQNSNESGLFLGIDFSLASKWSVSAYCDFFSFPWLKYRTDAPSNGMEYLAKLTYLPSRRIEFYLQYRQKNKMQNSSESSIIHSLDETQRKSLRFNTSYNPLQNLTLKNRIEFINYRVGNNYNKNGFLIYQDISYQLIDLPIRISTRYAIFDTDTYDERLYAYESDVLYAFSIPAYYYKGSRFYLMLKYDVSKNIDLWLRYATTYYNGKNIIGSGLDEIQGSSKSEIKAQVMVKF